MTNRAESAPPQCPPRAMRSLAPSRASLPRLNRARARARIQVASTSESSTIREASVRVILQLDDGALRQLAQSVEGRRVRDEIALDDLARRVRALRDALPRSCAARVFELVIERPGLVCDGGAAQGRGVARCVEKLGGTEEMERLCAECAPGFAHVLWRLGFLDTAFDECERALREWIRGEEGWHRVFTNRIASEYGYLAMMSRVETKSMGGNGVVFRNVKTGESVAFRRNERLTDGQ